MICVSVWAKDTAQALEEMELGSPLADLLELRLDAMEKPDLELLLAHKKTPVIVTVRPPSEGGSFGGTEKERLELLLGSIALGADFVDVELRAPRPFLRRIIEEVRQRGTTKLILSWHNWSYTPPLAFLVKLARKCVRLGADIPKVVTMARRFEDNLIALNLISWGASRGIPIVSFCMGETGRVSRVMAPLFGAPFTYGCMDKGKEAAPGQIPVRDIRKVLGILDNNFRKET